MQLGWSSPDGSASVALFSCESSKSHSECSKMAGDVGEKGWSAGENGTQSPREVLAQPFMWPKN